MSRFRPNLLVPLSMGRLLTICTATACFILVRWLRFFLIALTWTCNTFQHYQISQILSTLLYCFFVEFLQFVLLFDHPVILVIFVSSGSPVPLYIVRGTLVICFCLWNTIHLLTINETIRNPGLLPCDGNMKHWIVIKRILFWFSEC